MYKQIIIARKDLHMSPGKLAAQVAHGSMAFLTTAIKNNLHTRWVYATEYTGYPNKMYGPYRHPDFYKAEVEAYNEGKTRFYMKPLGGNRWERVEKNEIECYNANFDLEKDLVEQWINGAFTKVVLQAKNRNQLMKAVEMAEELGMKEGEDYFLIKDNCYTELEPEEVDENGVGRTLTCIGFRPMDAETIDKIGKKFHVFEGEIV